MNTHDAYQIYRAQAQNNANYQSTILWILFTILVLAPLLVGFAYVIVGVLTIKRCPKCHKTKILDGIQTKKNGDSNIAQPIKICANCKTVL